MPVSVLPFYHSALTSSTTVAERVIFFKVVVLTPQESLPHSSAPLTRWWPLEPLADT